MVQTQDRVAQAVAWLVSQSHLMRPESLPAAAEDAARLAGAAGCRIHLVTRDQRFLVLLSEKGPEAAGGDAPELLSLDGTVAGWTYRDTEPMTTADGTRVWMPLLDGTERLGVLKLLVEPGQDAELLRQTAGPLASVVAELVVSQGQYTDTFERVRRALPMGVPSELLWRQLPPLTFGSDRFVVTAQLEPWDRVGGDAFDYSVDGDTLHLAVFDAMGNGLTATLMASVALAVYRNCRRDRQGLVEMAAAIDECIAQQFGDECFVTAVLAQLDLATGKLCMLSAAHPAPLLVREGRALGELDSEPGVPLGLGGRDLRRLVATVMEHQHGILQDDATLLMLEWRGDSAAVVPSQGAL